MTRIVSAVLGVLMGCLWGCGGGRGPATRPAVVIDPGEVVSHTYMTGHLIEGEVDQAPGQSPAEARAAAVAELIRAAVAPGTWGPPAGIEAQDGQVTVLHTRGVQERVTEVVEALRRYRGAEVSIEVRVLDFGGVPRRRLPDVARRRLRDAQPTATPMSDAEVRELIRATQSAAAGALVTLPRVTLYNGQRGSVVVATQTAYVRGFSGGGAEEARPEVDAVNSGILINSQPLYRGPGRPLTLVFSLELTELLEMRSEPYAGAPRSAGLFVQRPRQRVRTVEQTLSGADGQVYLLSGLRESTREGDKVASSKAAQDVLVVVRAAAASPAATRPATRTEEENR